MHHNIPKEKRELNILTGSLGSKNNNNNFIIKTANAQRPDTLEIKVKPDNIVNIITKVDTCLENVNSWSSDSLDNFILQIKNANNTPSPITPNSFFNPSDVTQDQEQFADALTLHLNKIKEDYKSSIEPTDSQYLSNRIQITSMSQEKPIPVATVSLGNKVFLLNQISHNLDSNDNQCVNYSVMDVPRNLPQQHDSPKSVLQHPIQISHFQTLRSDNTPQTILCSGQNLQFTSYPNNEIKHILSNSNDQNQQIIHPSFFKTEPVLFTRVPDSSQSELLNSLTNSVSRINPNVVPVINNNNLSLNIGEEHIKQSLSPSSNDNDSSYGTNDSSVKTLKKDGSSNGSKLQIKDDKDMDDMQRRLERKRARNRDAARKCRDRKNSLITTLEQKYAKQSAEKDLIREKLLKSLEEIRRLTEYISKHDPISTFANFSSFLSEIKIHELTEADLKDLNLL